MLSVSLKKRKLFCYAVALILAVTAIAGAGLFPAPAVVYALSAGGIKSTIASIIISLLLQCGVAPTNTEWLNTLNTSYGVTSSIGTIEDCITNELLIESGGTLVDNGLLSAIESAPAYTDLALDNMFATTASDALSGAVVAGSGASNILTSAINVGTLGTIGAFAGAATIGVGLGFLINHVRENWGKNIESTIPIDASIDVYSLVGDGQYYSGVSITDNQTTNYLAIYNDDIVVTRTPSASFYNYWFWNVGGVNTNNPVTIVEKNGLGKNTTTVRNTTYTQNESVDGFGWIQNVAKSRLLSEYNFTAFNTEQDMLNYIYNIRNGVIDKPIKRSPDLIGTEGNQYGDSQLENMIPEGYDMMPVDMDDYNDFVTNANSNTDQGLTDEENQGVPFVDMVNNLLTESEEPSVPSDPVRPVDPDQPDLPNKPEPDEQTKQDVLNMASPDLKDVFPFCIPFDVAKILGIFKSDTRKAPYIKCPVDNDGNYIEIDLSRFDDAAALLRMLELIAFVVGLAVATRSLIGAN